MLDFFGFFFRSPYNPECAKHPWKQPLCCRLRCGQGGGVPGDGAGDQRGGRGVVYHWGHYYYIPFLFWRNFSVFFQEILQHHLPRRINDCNVVIGAVLFWNHEAVSVTVTVFLSVLCGNQLL